MIAKFQGRSLKISPSEVIRPQRPRKAQQRILKKMSGDNPDFPMDAKNSIGFFVPFFWG